MALRGCRKVLTKDHRIGVAGDTLGLHYISHDVVMKTLGYGCEYFLPNPFIGLELNYPILGFALASGMPALTGKVRSSSPMTSVSPPFQ